MNFSWTLAGNLVYAGCQWAMLMLLAKQTSPEELGRFSLGLAITAPVFMFSGLQLRALQATDAKRHTRFADYLTLRFVGTAAALVVCAGIALSRAKLDQEVLVVIGLALAKAVESVSDVFYGLFQQNERMDRVSQSLMLRGVLGLTLLTAGILLGKSAAWGTAGLVVAWTIVLLVWDVPGRSLEPSRPADLRTAAERIQELSRVARTGIPLGVVMLIISLNTNIPRYFLRASHGERALGLFAALASALTLGQMVTNALGQSASPRLARLAACGQRAGFLRLLAKLIGIASVLGLAGIIAAILLGRPVVTLLFTAEYAEHVPELVVIMIAAGLGFIGSFLGYAMTALRAFYAQIPLCVTACTVTGVWAWCDVPRAGLMGASRAVVAGTLALVIWSALVVRASLPEEGSGAD